MSTKIAEILRGSTTTISGWADKIESICLLTQSEKQILHRNLKFQKLHKGQRAFIIANGPSIANQELSHLKSEITFGSSGFYKHEIVNVWQPTYYSIIDPLFFNDPKIFIPFFRELNSKVSQSTFFLTLTRGYSANMKYNLLPTNKTFYSSSYGSSNTRQLDITNVTFGFQNVSAFSLGLAVYMECNPIYLIGFDHDYLVERGISRHFYQGCILGGELKEIHENKPISEIYSYYETMKFMQKFWENYMALDKIAKLKGIKIFNATDGGYLDVFERINYNEIEFEK